MEEVREFMHAPVISVDPQTTAQAAAAIMGEKGIGSLLIMKNDDYLGILTKTDLVKNVLAGGLDPQCTKVYSVMAKPIVTLDHQASKSEAIELMVQKKIKHLAVTKHGEIVGVLSTTDILGK
jgi:CBS domain-containing protein